MQSISSLLFGTAGIPLSTEPRETLSGIRRVKELGLGAMEVEFVHGINLTAEKAAEAKAVAAWHKVVLTCHAPYYINLNAADPATVKASVQRILQSCRVMEKAGGWSVCFHPGFYLKQDAEAVFRRAAAEMKGIARQLNDEGINLWLRPETTGKPSAVGSLAECIRLSQEVDGILPCVDFAHLHARSGGKVNTPEEFRQVLEQLEAGLGKEALRNMHIHLSGIAYTPKGEQHHLFLEESDLKWRGLLKVWKEFNLRGVVIAESPNIEADALLMQGEWGKVC